MDALIGLFGPWANEIDVLLGGKSDADEASAEPLPDAPEASPAETDD